METNIGKIPIIILNWIYNKNRHNIYNILFRNLFVILIIFGFLILLDTSISKLYSI